MTPVNIIKRLFLVTRRRDKKLECLFMAKFICGLRLKLGACHWSMMPYGDPDLTWPENTCHGQTL
jgi:hypothetical protein